MTLRMLNISAEWVTTGDLGRLPTVFSADLAPSQARELQGRIMFTFQELEVPDVSIFAMPGVLDYIARLHTAIPHLLYFLAPHTECGAIQGLLYSMLAGDERDAALASNQIEMPDHAVSGLIERFVVAANYATHVGDDWRPVVEELLDAFAPDVQAYFLEEVRQGLLR